MEEAYIYSILCTSNGKLYIGSSINFERRWKNHKSKLSVNKHCNAHLQSAWNKYGKDAFEFFILESCLEGERYDREQYWIDKLRVADDDVGFNLDRQARPIFFSKSRKSKKGLPHAYETKKKLSQLQSHKHLSGDVILAIYTMHAEGCRITNIIKKLNIKRSLVSKIVNKKALYANNIIEDFLGSEVYS